MNTTTFCSTSSIPHHLPLKGRGSSLQTPNPFLKHTYIPEFQPHEAEEENVSVPTRIIPVEAKTMINEVNSSDLSLRYSLNPYQGCEHGCAYCYARPTHEYWGLSAGTDFEQTVFYKRNALEVLKKELLKKKDAEPIMLSGNTDCYQPAERKLGLTRRILKMLLDFEHPVAIITKNSLVLRDLDLLKKMADKNLVFVYVSIHTMEENVRRVLEPRTSTIRNRFHVLSELSRNGIPCGTMISPIIPGLNNMHIPQIIKLSWEHGAHNVHYSVVRLNDVVSDIFKNWLQTHLPDRFEKVWNMITSLHGGSVQDKRPGVRLTGEGPYAEIIRQLFLINKQRYFKPCTFKYNTHSFKNHQQSVLQPTLF